MAVSSRMLVTLASLIPSFISVFAMLSVESSTEAFTRAPMLPGHAENSASLRPAENLDQFTSSFLPVTTTASTPAPTSDRPFEDTSVLTSCAPWFVCVHGTCSEGMSCSCYEGWAGLLCEEPCPGNCAPHGTCVTSSSNQAVCVCNDTSMFISEVGCVDKPPEPPTTTSPTTSAAASLPPTTPTTGDLGSAEDKDCLGIFTCVHGSCQMISLACDCDRGWKGQLCDQSCELSCGEHGKCREKDFILHCDCDYPYTGDNCENTTSTTTELSTAASQPISPITNMELDLSPWFNLGRIPASDGGNKSGASVASTVSHVLVVTERTRSAVTSTPMVLRGTGAPTDGTSTLGNISQRQCLPGFVCQHGHCPKGEISCVCDNGWGGTFCHLACNLTCGENGTCVVHDGESPYCQCESGHFNEGDCQQPIERSQTPSTTTKPTITTYFTSSVTGSLPSTEGDPWHHLESENGQLLPLAQRFCFGGIICAYGNCSRVNGSSATCVCEPKYTGPFCQYPCPLDCGQQGECTYSYTNNTAQCECRFPYTGTNCTEIISPKDEEFLPTVWIACLVAVFFLLSVALLIVLSMWLYKKRNIAVMKLVHWLQPFEEDDSKEYDAFVSYSSSDQDRQFVLQTLVPRLEGRMCFTLCIHQRNFVAGQFISDNIVESVKRSRRTLLVVSPSFVSSGWCRFEYQMALQEMLNEKHRVLPIIIGDINSVRTQIDDTLKSILKTVTWLEYPSKCSSEQEYDKFWKRLELSMPKKRSVQLELGNTQSCLALPSSAMSTEDSKEKDALPTSYLLSNECSNTGLLQRIVRVPARHMDCNDSSVKTGNVALIEILEKHQEQDSQNGTVGSTFANTSLDIPSSELSSSKSFSGESCTNSALDNPETESTTHIPGSPVPSDQHALFDSTSQGTHLSQDCASNNECSDEEDLPACMLQNYLGTLEIGNAVTV